MPLYRLRVPRHTPADEFARESVYELEGQETEKLLDLLRRIQREQDPTLGCRAACYTGKCGTCNVRLDGRSKLSCQAMVAPGEHSVQASRTGRLIRDLITEWPFTR